MASDSASLEPATDGVTRWLLVAVGVYTILLVGILNLTFLKSGKVEEARSS